MRDVEIEKWGACLLPSQNTRIFKAKSPKDEYTNFEVRKILTEILIIFSVKRAN